MPRPRSRRLAARRRGHSLIAALAGLVLGCSHADDAQTTAPAVPPPVATTPTWTLAWSDEFAGAAGATVDPASWTAETGGSGWGNREREYYTTRTDNAALDGDGHLVITARAEPASGGPARTCWYGACRYTSARLVTKGRVSATYGRVEARLKLPVGQGIWPAFWMLGGDVDQVGWPACGEIDIMEQIGREPAMIHGTLHGPGYSGAASIGKAFALTPRAFADSFHVFAVEWTPNQIRWLVDDREYHRMTPSTIPTGARWVFDHPFFVILNLAVGGDWPGDPDATTTFPQAMTVDYVRVYRQSSGGA